MRREPPDADPHVRWCGRRRGEPGAYPIDSVTSAYMDSRRSSARTKSEVLTRRTSPSPLNGDGKTNILIRSEDKNVFIAECKFYNGPASASRTIDQLFRYANGGSKPFRTLECLKLDLGDVLAVLGVGVRRRVAPADTCKITIRR